ncbi:hypothetical protein [Janibacter melonis]|uniref:hypothetical protein n=1 Tax=Janibacter melonis TaxID=262209 RepID=UPI00174C212C|nr:hypothetical protein [Janibacter melonis]
MSSSLLRAHEVAERLAQDIKTIRRNTRRGLYPFARNLGTPQQPIWRYDARGLERWLDTRRHDVA